jgi:hypothetical protein
LIMPATLGIVMGITWIAFASSRIYRIVSGVNKGTN